MAASEAIRLRELAQLGRFSFRRARLFLTSSLSSLWRFASFLTMARFALGLLLSETREVQL
jgi:hypothetical protein